jgi:hypothetical protein
MTGRDDRASPGSTEGGVDTEQDRCDHCGDPIDTDDWHPVATRRDDDGRIQIRDFCCDDCRDAWLRERGRDSDYSAD